MPVTPLPWAGRLLPLLAGSFLLHLLVLALPGFEAQPPVAPRLADPATATGRIVVRLRESAPPLPIASAVPVAPRTPDADASAASADGGLQRSLAPPVPTAATTQPAEAALPVLPAWLPRATERVAYLPADELDERPAPEAPIVIGLEPSLPVDRERAEVVLSLYVGESGSLDRVEVGRSDLPAALAEGVADAFRGARMRPGIKSGVAVRSVMKVLVEFESRDIPR